MVFSSPEAREEFDELEDAMSRFTKREIEEGVAEEIESKKRTLLGTRGADVGFTTAKPLPDGTVFSFVYTPQYDEDGQQPSKDGPPEDPKEEVIAYTYVFPDGTAEHTVVRIADEEDPEDGWTIEVMPISGEISMTEEVIDPEESLDSIPEEGPEIPMILRRVGFTLLEVIIALGILAGGARCPGRQPGHRCSRDSGGRSPDPRDEPRAREDDGGPIILERQGFGEQDIEEDGDFEDFGAEEFRGDELHLGLTDDIYEDFKGIHSSKRLRWRFPTSATWLETSRVTATSGTTRHLRSMWAGHPTSATWASTPP